MREALATEEGKARYALRQTTVEPVFGQIKGARGIRRFRLRGLLNVTSEWKLICATHNLLKTISPSNDSSSRLTASSDPPSSASRQQLTYVHRPFRRSAKRCFEELIPTFCLDNEAVSLRHTVRLSRNSPKNSPRLTSKPQPGSHLPGANIGTQWILSCAPDFLSASPALLQPCEFFSVLDPA